MFNIFNTSGDGSMSLQEFKECYDSWVVKVFRYHNLNTTKLFTSRS